MEFLTNDEDLDRGIVAMLKRSKATFEPMREGPEILVKNIAMDSRKIKRLLSTFGDEDNPTIAMALESEIRSAAAVKERHQ